MTAPFRTPAPREPAPHGSDGAWLDKVAELMDTAAGYAALAAQSAALRDARVLSYAVRCATAAAVGAAELLAARSADEARKAGRRT